MNFKAILVGALATVAASVAVAPTVALAQESPVILFIDQGKLMATSKAGLNITAQMKTLADQAEASLKAEGKKVEDEGKKLQDSKDSLSKEDFAKRYQALLAKAQQVGQLEQIKKAELAQAQGRALNDLNTVLQPVVKDILEKRKATVLLERSAVVFANESMDITDEIVAALDKKVTTIKVVKPDLLAEAKKAEAAAAAKPKK